MTVNPPCSYFIRCTTTFRNLVGQVHGHLSPDQSICGPYWQPLAVNLRPQESGGGARAALPVEEVQQAEVDDQVSGARVHGSRLEPPE
jgi:hypothetical protein